LNKRNYVENQKHTKTAFLSLENVIIVVSELKKIEINGLSN